MDNGNSQSALEFDRPPEGRFVEIFRRTAPILGRDLETLVREHGPLDRATPSASIGQRFRSWRWAAAVSLAALLVAAGFWLSLTASQMLLAQVGDRLGRVTSYRCSMSFSRPNAKADQSQTGMIYWAAPRSYRSDTLRNGKLVETSIRPSNKPGIEIHFERKTFSRLPPNYAPTSPVMLVQNLAAFRGTADRDLGQAKIGNSKVHGFEIKISKVDANLVSDGKLRVWADVKTMLPVKIEMDKLFGTANGQMADFAWNEPPDRWFDTAAPSGFRELSPPAPTPAPTPAIMAEQIVDAFRIYRKFNGGSYPKVERIQGEAIRWQLRKAAGVDRIALTRSTPANEKQAFFETQRAQEGLVYLTRLPEDNPDVAYYGMTVGPADKGKVLFRWKLDGGAYMVIYGDLRHEAVSRQRLQELEKK